MSTMTGRLKETKMSAITDFLFAAPASRSTTAIIAWWERRRLAYNACVGAAGLVSLGSVGLADAMTDGTGLFPGAFLAAIVVGGMANLCYFFGPVAELLSEKLWGRSVLPTGPLLYRMGLTFSVGLVLFPTFAMVFLMTVRVILALLGVTWS